jgi:hypothetical protein
MLLERAWVEGSNNDNNNGNKKGERKREGGREKSFSVAWVLNAQI